MKLNYVGVYGQTDGRNFDSKSVRCVTNLVSVLPATPYCKPNSPVHPHSKPKSGLGRGYISSDRPQSTRTWCRGAKLLVERRRTPGLGLGAETPGWSAPGTDGVGASSEQRIGIWKGLFILQRRAPHSSSEEELIVHPPKKSLSSFIFQRRAHPSSIFSIYLLHLLRRVSPLSTEVSSSFIYLHLPKEVSPVREVTERHPSAPRCFIKFASGKPLFSRPHDPPWGMHSEPG